MKLASLLPLATATALLLPAAAAQAAPAKVGPVDYKITKATHTSTSSYSDEHYQGKSTATWSLAKASKLRMNWLTGGMFSGGGRVNVKGAYTLDTTTDWPGRCVFTAPTGDQAHGEVAPRPFDLNVTPDARRPGTALVGFVASHATLKNAYTGTECTPNAEEPEWKDKQTINVAPSRLRGKTITLTFAGQRAGGPGVASYTWKTEIVLKRVSTR